MDDSKDRAMHSEQVVTTIQYSPYKIKCPEKRNIIIISSLLIAMSLLIYIILPTLNNISSLSISFSNDDDSIIIEPKEKQYTHCIIFLPGLGTEPRYFVKMLTNDLDINKKNTTKIIILRPPKMTLSNGRTMISWFDITLPVKSRKDYSFEDAQKSSYFLKTIIKREAKLLNGKYNKIFIGGHSQGACISLLTGYTVEYNLGGILAFSGVLFPETKILKNKEKLNVFISHGYTDRIVYFNFHSKSIKRIEKYEGVEIHHYEHIGHGIGNEVKDDLCKFLNRVMV